MYLNQPISGPISGGTWGDGARARSDGAQPRGRDPDGHSVCIVCLSALKEWQDVSVLYDGDERVGMLHEMCWQGFMVLLTGKREDGALV